VKKGKKIMRSFKMNFISSVDRPAQEPAEALLLKRRDSELDDFERLLKSGQLMLTSDKKGHSHLIDVAEEGGVTSHNTASGAEYGHSHPWVKTMDGIVVIGAAEGHSHSLIEKRHEPEDDGRKLSTEQRRVAAEKGDALPDGGFLILNEKDLVDATKAFDRARDKGRVALHIERRARALGVDCSLSKEGRPTLGKSVKDDKLSKEQSMEDKDKKTAEDMVKKSELQEAQAELAVAKAYGALSDVEKAHYGDLDKDEKSAFLKLDENGRANELKKANAEDPVAYTADDGREFRKSDDVRLVEEVKKGDEERRKNAALAKKLEDQELTKRADGELGNVTGDVDVKIALLKAVDGIENEDLKKGAKEILAAANDGMSQLFKTSGHRDGSAGNAETKYESLSKAYAKENDVTIEQARAKVLDTPEGAKLYEEMQG